MGWYLKHLDFNFILSFVLHLKYYSWFRNCIDLIWSLKCLKGDCMTSWRHCFWFWSFGSLWRIFLFSFSNINMIRHIWPLVSSGRERFPTWKQVFCQTNWFWQILSFLFHLAKYREFSFCKTKLIYTGALVSIGCWRV